MTGNEWTAAFALELGVTPPDADAVEQLLELAGVAAHASERTAAPIACFLLGRSGVDLRAALERARRVGDQPSSGG